MNKLRCLVVDDELAFIKNLESMIALNAESNLEIVGNARSVKEAIDKIDSLKPDLVFLDIELPDGKGFKVLNGCQYLNFSVIFITAYDQYAIEAFRHSAVDYLLKPVSSGNFWDAVAKASEAVALKDRQMQLEILIDNLKGVDANRRKLVLREGDNMHIVQVEDIRWCEAQGSYTLFHLENKEDILVCHHLKDYEEMLTNGSFVRTHRSYLVNLDKIKRFDKSEGGSVYLDDDTQIPVSFRKKEQLMQRLEKL